MEILFIVTLVIIFVLLYDKYKTKQEHKEIPKQESKIDLNGKYKSKHLLTKAEYSFYSILKKICEESNLLICPKVRLEDFIQVTAQEKSKYRGYIKSRHIDFLICDAKLHVIGALELDDNSHNTQKAQVTDNFKNELYKTIQLPLFRIKTTDNYSEKIKEMIETLQHKSTP